MTIASMDYLPDRVRLRATPMLFSSKLARRLHTSTTKMTLIALSAFLLCASIAAYGLQACLLAGRNAADGCGWYTVESGDTLTIIANHYHTTISMLAHANVIRNRNLIFVGQRICIPHHGRAGISHGVTANGTVRWYAYSALEWSNQGQVRRRLYRAAARHRLPSKLVLAIAWQESGWTQHVIARDGGIGVMQLMPYTAMGINAGIGQLLDPYILDDNLDLGTTYLEWLWRSFHGDLKKVISAYNEGGWAVRHRGIYNWHYVNNVLALMRNLG